MKKILKIKNFIVTFHNIGMLGLKKNYQKVDLEDETSVRHYHNGIHAAFTVTIKKEYQSMSEAIDHKIEEIYKEYTAKHYERLLEPFSKREYNNIIYFEINKTKIGGSNIKSIILIKPLNEVVIADLFISTSLRTREELTDLSLKIMEEVTVAEK